MYNFLEYCAYSSMDRAAVFGTDDEGSTPPRRTSYIFLLLTT